MAELLEALRDPSLPVPGRLKVARYLLKTREDILPRGKLSYLLKWVCQELCLIYNKKNKSQRPPPLEAAEQLWGFLSKVVGSVGEDRGGGEVELSPINVHLFQGMGVVFSLTADDDVVCRQALACLRGILNLPNLPPSLSVFEIMVPLLESVLKLGMACWRHASSQLRCLFSPSTLVLLLDYYIYLEGTQWNKKKVFATICNQLLSPALILRSLALAGGGGDGGGGGGRGDDGTSVGDLVGRLDAILNPLFCSDLLPEYSSTLSSCLDKPPQEEGGAAKSALSSTRLLFDVLKKFLESEDKKEAIESIPILFEVFLKENSKTCLVPKNIEFNFFIKIVSLLNIDSDSDGGGGGGSDGGGNGGSGGDGNSDGNSDGDCSGSDGGDSGGEAYSRPSLKEQSDIVSTYFHLTQKKSKKRDRQCVLLTHEALSLETLRRCLEMILHYDVYSVVEDMNSGQKQATYFRCLTKCMLTKMGYHLYGPSNMCPPGNGGLLPLSCLSVLLKLNHLLVEPWLPVLWIITPTAIAMDTANCELINTCIDIYTKLRQLPTLLKSQLEATDILISPSCPPISTSISPSTPSLPTSPPLSPLTPSSQALLEDSIALLPPGQATDILQLHVSYFLKHQDNLLSSPSLKMAVGRTMDVFAVFLSRAPLVVWSGRGEGRGLELLRVLVEEVCHKYLVSAVPELKVKHSSLPVTSLQLVSHLCDLVTRLFIHSPSPSSPLQLKWPLYLVKRRSSSEFLVPRQWKGGVVKALHPVGTYLLKRLTIQQIKFQEVTMNSANPTDPMNSANPVNSTDPMNSANPVNSTDPMNSVNLSIDEMLDFIFLFSDEPEGLDTSWDGKPTSLDLHTHSLGHWSLLLSNLPHLYESCSDAHLKVVATFVLQALASDSGRGSDGGGEGVSLRSVVQSFLQSESFGEMKKLQEYLFFSYLSSVRYKSVPKVLKKALKLCGDVNSGDRSGSGDVNSGDHSGSGDVNSGDRSGSGDGIFVSEFPSTFRSVLDHGLKELRAGERGNPCNYDFSKMMNVWKLEVYMKLITSFPVHHLRRHFLLRSFLAGVVYQVAMVDFLACVSQEDECLPNLLASLRDLTYILTWHLHGYLRRAAAAGTSKKAKRNILRENELDLLFKWFYHVSFVIHDHHSSLPVQSCDSLVSIMVAMEIILERRAERYGYSENLPLEIIGDVMDDSKSSHLVGCGLVTIAEVTCRGSKSKTGKLKNHTSLHHMTGLVLDAINKLIADDSPASIVLTTHPYLVSVLAMLMTLYPMPETPRVVSKLLRLESTTKLPSLSVNTKTGLHIAVLFEKFMALLDCIALNCAAAKRSKSTSQITEESATRMESDSETSITGMELETQDGETQSGDNVAEMGLVPIWTQLKHVLVALFEEKTGKFEEITLNVLKDLATNKKSERTVGVVSEGGGARKSDVMYRLMLNKISSLQLQVLNSVSEEEMTDILHLMKKEVLDTRVCIDVYCFSWYSMLDTKLPQNIKTLIQPYLHTGALLSCLSVAELYSKNSHTHFQVAMAIQLASQIVSIPSHMGVSDSLAILSSLHLCSFSNISSDSRSIMVFKVVEACAELLAGVLRQHTSVVSKTPGPFVIATNKLLHAVMMLGQRVSGDGDGGDGETSLHLKYTLHCASLISRSMEMLSHQKSLYRFFAYIIREYMMSSQSQDVCHEVKQVLLPGLFSLINLCNPPELAFLKASVDSSSREAFNSLMEQFNRSYKFGGRV